MNRENCLRLEKNHSLSMKLHSDCTHKRSCIWDKCTKSTIVGMSMVNDDILDLVLDSRDSQCRRNLHLSDIRGKDIINNARTLIANQILHAV